MSEIERKGLNDAPSQSLSTHTDRYGGLSARMTFQPHQRAPKRPERSYQCDRCTMSYYMQRDLRRHYLTKHQVGGEVFRCDRCDRCDMVFHRPDNLKVRDPNRH